MEKLGRITIEERFKLNQQIQLREAYRFKRMMERKEYVRAYNELAENPGLVSRLNVYDAGQIYQSFKNYDPNIADYFLKVFGDMINLDELGAPLTEEREMQEIQISRRIIK